jgi:hypothetical protein
MNDLVGAFKAFAAREIFERSLPFPVKAELLSAGMQPMVETVVKGPDAFGIWAFEKLRALPGPVWKQSPRTVRFTPDGQTSFIKEFPWPDQPS